MSICKLGLKNKPQSKEITITLTSDQPLVKLAELIPWELCFELIKDDLKKTNKSRWQVGRKLQIRTHLGAYFLKSLKNLTYRGTEQELKENAASQYFCGATVIAHWRCPDHTKLEKFSNRLSPATQQRLANLVSELAVGQKFADPRCLDIDSTIQEANIRYPNDWSLLSRVVDKCKQSTDKLMSLGVALGEKFPSIDAKSIKGQVKHYLFNRNGWSDEEKAKHQLALLAEAEKYIKPTIEVCKALSKETLSSLSWNIQQAIAQITEFGERCLSQAKSFAQTGKVVGEKLLSLHIKEVACFKKRHRMNVQFGRRVQLGRIGGNFLIVPDSSQVKQVDSDSVELLVETHEQLFGAQSLASCAADTGYYSKKNERYLHDKKVTEIGLQKPNNTKFYLIEMSEPLRKQLYERRAGIEPLIGHCKAGGQLGRHREKTDKAGLTAVYRSVLGFNLRQMMNKLIEVGQGVPLKCG